MTKKRKQPSLEELLARPWCYYCDRDFDDTKILTNHQKAKHLKCSHCTRRLNTAGGLAVHMQQVHKETLTTIENALPGREDPNVEIFAAEGIPEDIQQLHRQRITEEYYANQADHRERTGNPAAGEDSAKKAKVTEKETPEEIKKRLAEWRARKAAGDVLTDTGGNTPSVQAPSPSNAQTESPFPPPNVATPPTYNQPYAQPPLASPPIGYPPFGHPGPAQQYPPQGYGMPGPYCPPGGFRGFAGSPQPNTHHMPPMPQPFQHPFSGPAPPHSHTFSPRPGMNGPSHPPGPPHHSPALHSAPSTHHSPQLNGPPRQNSLPAAPGLPARPSFDAPPVSRHQLHEMHQGSKPADVGVTVHHQPRQTVFNADIDELIQTGQQEASATNAMPPAPSAPESAAEEAPKVAMPPRQEPVKTQENGTTNVSTPTQAHEQTNTSSTTKSKKTVNVVVKDKVVSAEENMAKMARYSFTPRKPETYLGRPEASVAKPARGYDDVAQAIR